MFSFLIFINLFVTIFTANNFPFNNIAELDPRYWEAQAQNDLLKATHRKLNTKRAKNVIIFIGGGMGLSTITPARILKGQRRNNPGEEEQLIFENFPDVCLLKTYDVNTQVSGSSGAATALLSGVKTNHGVFGATARVKQGDGCKVLQDNMVTSIFDRAHESGKGIGLITNNRLTQGAAPGAYASSASKYWEGIIPKQASYHPTNEDCKDIARQLLESHPGKNFNVLFGGGSVFLYGMNMTNPNNNKPGGRMDGLNLVNKWHEYRASTAASPQNYKFIYNRDQLIDVNTKADFFDHVLGVFHESHMSFELERDRIKEPSLDEMTEAGINILHKFSNGFVLLVESGNIDLAHHENMANIALGEVLALDKAVQRALNMVSLDETLIVVTGDHSQGITMNGNVLRGNNIMGVAEQSHLDKKLYTTLMYSTGPGYKINRDDPANVITDKPRYVSHSAIYMNSSRHTGEDVALYSIGPMSHLFHGTKEESYVAHAMEFAACIGRYKHYDHCDNKEVKPVVKPEVKPEVKPYEVITPQKSSATFTAQIISIWIIVLFLNISIILFKYAIN